MSRQAVPRSTPPHPISPDREAVLKLHRLVSGQAVLRAIVRARSELSQLVFRAREYSHHLAPDYRRVGVVGSVGGCGRCGGVVGAEPTGGSHA